MTHSLNSIAGNEESCGITPDPEIAAFIAEREAENELCLSEVIGQIPKDTTSDRNLVRKQEAALGNLITDAFRWKTGADFATFNSSGIRADLLRGDFTREHLLNLFLTQNPVITVEVDGGYIHATDGEPDFHLDTVGKENPAEGIDFQSGYGSFREIFLEYITTGLA